MGMKVGINLQGNAKTVRDVMDIVNQESQLGIAEIDRGSKVFNPEGGKDGKGAWEHVPDVSNELAIDLVVNEGKGYGSQTVSEDDLSDVLGSLTGIVEADFQRAEGAPEEYQPPGQVIEASWRMVFPKREVFKDGKVVTERDENHPEGRCMVSFRTRNGRGAKPAEIHRDRLPELIARLELVVPTVPPRKPASETGRATRVCQCFCFSSWVRQLFAPKTAAAQAVGYKNYTYPYGQKKNTHPARLGRKG
jgi:hypothetical protein